MADLQARLDNVFGALGSSANADNPPWHPARHPVFRTGTECDSRADPDEEYHERRRRLEGMDFTAEDAPDASGMMPSPAFCAQLDAEEEEDAADATALALEADPRPSPGTEVADDDAYGRLCAALHAPDDASPMDEDAGGSPAGCTLGGGGSARQRAPSPSSSGSLKSNLRRGVRPAGIKKRVSFTGLPEPPKPWVPPHKRPGYVRTGAAPPLPSPSPPSLGFLTPPSAAAPVPDHVANPGRYRRYELDESLIVGGGMGQLASGGGGGSGRGAADRDVEGEQAVQDALAAARIGDEPEGEGQERWQGPVGGGIEFRPRQASAAAGPSSEAWAGAGGVAIAFSGEEGEEGGDAAAGGDGAKAARQYRRRPAAEDPPEDEEMVE